MRLICFSLLLVLLLPTRPLRAQSRYWDASYDSLRRTLPQQRTDQARLRTLVHLLDLTELTDEQRRSQALPLIDELLAVNARAKHLDERPYRWLQTGVRHWLEGRNYPAALRALQQAIDYFDEGKHPVPRLLIDLGPVYNKMRDQQGRLEYFQHKATDYHLRGQLHNAAACHLVLVGSHRQQGDLNRAISHSLRAAELLKPLERRHHVSAIMLIGLTYAEWGNLEKATQYLHQARQLEDDFGFNDMRRFATLQGLARLQLQQGQPQQALQHAEHALRIARNDTVIREVGLAYGLLLKSAALVRLAPAQAYPLLRRAQQLADSLQLRVSGRLGEFPLDATWAQYHEAQGETAAAEARWLTAYRRALAGRFVLAQPGILKELIRFYDEHEQPARVRRFTRRYLALSDSLETVQSGFRVAQYEAERLEQARLTQIANLQQTQAVQASRLRQSGTLLIGALVAIMLVSGLGVGLYRQLRLNKRTLAQLRQTQAQLIAAEKWAFVGEVSAGIAHELQNPLNFMKRFAEVSTRMIDGMPPANGAATNGATHHGLQHEIVAGLKQNLQEISQHGLRASSIIRDMLAHSRTGTARRQPTDLNALVAEHLRLAYDDQTAQAAGFAPGLRLDLDPSLPAVSVVPQDMGRVLLNLFTNALYALRQRPNADGRPELRVSTRQVGERIEVRVRDNGPGMNAAVQARIFEPFFTTKPVGEGTGLGLSLSHDIVTKGHGGTLRVETQEGSYTEFVVTLDA